MTDDLAADRVPLAGSEVTIPRLGVGTWAWGDRRTWGYDAARDEDGVRGAWAACLDAGVTLIDTAEVYGGGESERIIGRLLAADPSARDRVVLASKYLPAPWRPPRRTLVDAARASAERMGVEAIDLYQVHGNTSLRRHATMADALAAAHQAGVVRAVGVSNYSARAVRAMDASLRERGLRLATNQVEYSLLRTMPEATGLLATCRELGVVVLAYSPIGQGRLTGKYSAANPPPSSRSFSKHPMAAVEPVVAELRRIGEAHGGRTPAQVALAWCIAKQTVPIPGARNRQQAEQNAGALGWRLGDTDLAALDAVALFGRRSIQNRFWQQG